MSLFPERTGSDDGEEFRYGEAIFSTLSCSGERCFQELPWRFRTVDRSIHRINDRAGHRRLNVTVT
jgi:hypothetical protein